MAPSRLMRVLAVVVFIFFLQTVWLTGTREQAPPPLEEVTVVNLPFATSLPPDAPREPITKGKRIVVGIPTMLRDGDIEYLSKTLQSLLHHMTEEDKSYHRIVIFNAETEERNIERLRAKMNATYGREISAGTVEVFDRLTPFSSIDHDRFPSRGPHSHASVHSWIRELYNSTNVCKLRPTLGHTLMRVKWRSHRCVDTAFLLDYAIRRGDLYLHLEDDTPASSEWLKAMINTADEFLNTLPDGERQKYTGENVIAGAEIRNATMKDTFGLLMNVDTARELTKYIYRNFDELPLEMLIGTFMKNTKRGMYQHKPIITHVGVHSTKEKVIEWEKNPTPPRIRVDEPIPPDFTPISWQECEIMAQSAGTFLVFAFYGIVISIFLIVFFIFIWMNVFHDAPARAVDQHKSPRVAARAEHYNSSRDYHSMEDSEEGEDSE
ncbi:hypothetical protein PROFUN_10459 [Planoprotostelium fungivorum]|uniref:Uncharacterized protein n=1 Tax=Planoprotostelium fungivorum TaxID=1890364 RepID=A0A2P6NDF9_9EUKA|nr:hypothetical protein PROFUN_10459 [Planoprotostelium fungivorum]